jgi:hypothetical protein
VVGDWDGDGKVSVGLYDAAKSTLFLKNSNAAGNADTTFTFGPADARPIAGPWA